MYVLPTNGYYSKKQTLHGQYQDSTLDVRVENETVWSNQAQMAELFQATKQNISLHINNIFKEEEFQHNSVVKEYLTTASDGKHYKTKYYNQDVIISVGYRVKSLRGTQHRKIQDHFLIIDDTLYHIVASIKDLGKKLFAF